MRLLIAVDPTRIIYLKKFCEELSKFSIETKIISEFDIYDDTFSSQKYFKWLQIPNNLKKLIKDFNPDLVFTERVGYFSSCILKLKIPLIIFLRGDYWREINFAKNSPDFSITEKFSIKTKRRIAEKCFKDSTLILPICNYLKNIVNTNYSNKSVHVLYQGIDFANWFSENGKKLQHPCVGIIQDSNLWEKTKELLILPEILEKCKDTHFYWIGDGQYTSKILAKLEKYSNFHWLGRLNFPNAVRQFLTEIDIYCLISGIDMSPHTILEASIMKKPILASNVGGVSESIKNNKTGILIDKGDTTAWITNIQNLIHHPERRSEMGNAGHDFVKQNFSWEKIAENFVNILKKEINLKK